MSKLDKSQKADISLEQIQKEINELLASVKPVDKLKKWQIYKVEKKWTINWIINFEKWDEIKILEIEKAKDETKTTSISFVINNNENIYKTSDGIFMVNFSEELKTEDDNFKKKLKALKDHEKQLLKKLKHSKDSEKIEKEQLWFFKKITKLLSKKTK